MREALFPSKEQVDASKAELLKGEVSPAAYTVLYDDINHQMQRVLFVWAGELFPRTAMTVSRAGGGFLELEYRRTNKQFNLYVNEDGDFREFEAASVDSRLTVIWNLGRIRDKLREARDARLASLIDARNQLEAFAESEEQRIKETGK